MAVAGWKAKGNRQRATGKRVKKGVLTLARRERARGVAAAFCTASAWPAASLGKLAMGPSYDPADRQAVSLNLWAAWYFTRLPSR